MWAKPNPDDVSAFVNDPDAIPKATRVMQIIVGTLTMGVVMFLLIVVLLLDTPARPPGAGQAAPETRIVTYLALAMGASALVASFAIPKLMVDAGLRQLVKEGASSTTKPTGSGAKQVDPSAEARRILPLFQTQLIIGCALAEGGAFFAGIAYMLEHQYLALGVAGVLLAALISRFPTVDRVSGWLDDQLGRLERLRRDEL
jgi:hypothetical protein